MNKLIAISSIKGVLFDLDNTLYEYAPCNQAGKQAVFKCLAKELNTSQKKVQVAYAVSRKKVNAQLKTTAASHSRLLYIQSTIERLQPGMPINVATWDTAHTLFWKAYLKQMKLRPGILNLLKCLQSRNIKIGIITDLTTQVQISKLRRLRIGSYIDAMVTSEEAGIEKPDPKMLKMILKKLNLLTKQVVVVGDSMEKDMALTDQYSIPFLHLEKNIDVENVHSKLM